MTDIDFFILTVCFSTETRLSKEQEAQEFWRC